MNQDQEDLGPPVPWEDPPSPAKQKALRRKYPTAGNPIEAKPITVEAQLVAYCRGYWPDSRTPTEAQVRAMLRKWSPKFSTDDIYAAIDWAWEQDPDRKAFPWEATEGRLLARQSTIGGKVVLRGDQNDHKRLRLAQWAKDCPWAAEVLDADKRQSVNGNDLLWWIEHRRELDDYMVYHLGQPWEKDPNPANRARLLRIAHQAVRGLRTVGPETEKYRRGLLEALEVDASAGDVEIPDSESGMAQEDLPW